MSNHTCFRRRPAAPAPLIQQRSHHLPTFPKSSDVRIFYHALMRMAAIIAIFAVAALVVLSELAINITPLIAAISIFGLALSFGSQTTWSVTSCRESSISPTMRFASANISIPAKQTTMKFNLRFARDTDVEKLRKTVKKVGLAMMEEPEFKDEFLEPLKLQGVADVADNALIMRFKFTAKPNIPTLIQREGMKRLFRAFQEAGIEFASATVSVQTIGGEVDQAAAAGAAATAAIAQASAAARGRD
jgi:moderate conductance mechanosensitive channel